MNEGDSGVAGTLPPRIGGRALHRRYHSLLAQEGNQKTAAKHQCLLAVGLAIHWRGRHLNRLLGVLFHERTS